jgi:hypothetical protein
MNKSTSRYIPISERNRKQLPHGYKKPDPTLNDDVDDPSLSENIDESPLKRDGRIAESDNQ